MKTILSFALFALVASMIAAPAFADSKLDSFVNLATQARTQVKLQLDKMPSAPEEARSLYAQGDQETEQLIAAVKNKDATGAKTHFLAALNAFRQVTMIFSEPIAVATPKMAAPKSAAPVPDFDYGNALKRFEANINILKSVAGKNNLPIDFSRIDNLLQTAKTNLADNDMETLEKTFADLKSAGQELQATIKDMVAQRSTARATSFANQYITKIDAVLAQAKDLGMSEDEITKLQNAKEELASSGDPTQIVIKIKRVYQINLDLLAAKNQKIISDISRLESRLVLLEPKIDDTIQPKFDAAKSILASLKDPTSTDDPVKLLRTLESTIKDIESYLLSLQTPPTNTNADQKTASQPEKPADKQDTPKESFQLQDTQKAQTESLKVSEPKADKQDRQKQTKNTKQDKQAAEISRIEAKLADLESQVDENIQPKFDAAQSMLAKLKESGNNYTKTIRAINSLIDEMIDYINSQHSDNSG